MLSAGTEFSEKTICLNNECQQILDIYKKVLEGLKVRADDDTDHHMAAGKEYLSGENIQTLALKHFEKWIGLKLGAHETTLAQKSVELSPMAEIVYDNYSKFLTKLLLDYKGKKAAILTEDSSISNKSTLVRELLLRFAAEALCVNNEGSRDGLIVIKAIADFLKKIIHSDIFLNTSLLGPKKFTPFAKSLSLHHQPWLTLFESVITVVQKMNAHKNAITMAKKTIGSLVTIMIQRLIVELAPIAKHDIANNQLLSQSYLMDTLNEFEKKAMSKLQLTNSQALQPYAQSNQQFLQSRAQLCNAVEKKATTKKKETHITDVYKTLEALRQLHIGLMKIKNMVDGLGWYPFLTGIVNFTGFVEQFEQTINACTSHQQQARQLIANLNSHDFPNLSVAITRHESFRLQLKSEWFQASDCLIKLNNPDLLKEIAAHYQNEFISLKNFSDSMGYNLINDNKATAYLLNSTMAPSSSTGSPALTQQPNVAYLDSYDTAGSESSEPNKRLSLVEARRSPDTEKKARRVSSESAPKEDHSKKQQQEAVITPKKYGFSVKRTLKKAVGKGKSTKGTLSTSPGSIELEEARLLNTSEEDSSQGSQSYMPMSASPRPLPSSTSRPSAKQSKGKGNRRKRKAAAKYNTMPLPVGENASKLISDSTEKTHQSSPPIMQSKVEALSTKDIAEMKRVLFSLAKRTIASTINSINSIKALEEDDNIKEKKIKAAVKQCDEDLDLYLFDGNPRLYLEATEAEIQYDTAWMNNHLLDFRQKHENIKLKKEKASNANSNALSPVQSMKKDGEVAKKEVQEHIHALFEKRFFKRVWYNHQVYYNLEQFMMSYQLWQADILNEVPKRSVSRLFDNLDEMTEQHNQLQNSLNHELQRKHGRIEKWANELESKGCTFFEILKECGIITVTQTDRFDVNLQALHPTSLSMLSLLYPEDKEQINSIRHNDTEKTQNILAYFALETKSLIDQLCSEDTIMQDNGRPSIFEGDTLLLYATRQYCLPIVNLLLKKGASPHTKNAVNNSALTLACYTLKPDAFCKDVTVFRILVEHELSYIEQFMPSSKQVVNAEKNSKMRIDRTNFPTLYELHRKVNNALYHSLREYQEVFTARHTSVLYPIWLYFANFFNKGLSYERSKSFVTSIMALKTCLYTAHYSKLADQLTHIIDSAKAQGGSALITGIKGVKKNYEQLLIKKPGMVTSFAKEHNEYMAHAMLMMQHVQSLVYSHDDKITLLSGAQNTLRTEMIKVRTEHDATRVKLEKKNVELEKKLADSQAEAKAELERKSTEFEKKNAELEKKLADLSTQFTQLLSTATFNQHNTSQSSELSEQKRYTNSFFPSSSQ